MEQSPVSQLEPRSALRIRAFRYRAHAIARLDSVRSLRKLIGSSRRVSRCSFKGPVLSLPRLSGYGSCILSSVRLCNSHYDRNRRTPALPARFPPHPSLFFCIARHVVPGIHSSRSLDRQLDVCEVQSQPSLGNRQAEHDPFSLPPPSECQKLSRHYAFSPRCRPSSKYS